MSSLVGPRGSQDGSPASWKQNRKNKWWQYNESAANGCKSLNQMALIRSFLMLLRVTSVGFPPSLWKINVLIWFGWPKMTHSRRSWKQVSVQERECSPLFFFNTQGPVVVDIMPDKATITATYYTTSVLPKVLLHNQSTARTRRRSRIQLHHDNAAPHIALNTQTYLDDNGIRLMEHPLYSPDLARAISDSFQKLNQPVLGSLF